MNLQVISFRTFIEIVLNNAFFGIIKIIKIISIILASPQT